MAHQLIIIIELMKLINVKLLSKFGEKKPAERWRFRSKKLLNFNIIAWEGTKFITPNGMFHLGKILRIWLIGQLGEKERPRFPNSWSTLILSIYLSRLFASVAPFAALSGRFHGHGVEPLSSILWLGSRLCNHDVNFQMIPASFAIHTE